MHALEKCAFGNGNLVMVAFCEIRVRQFLQTIWAADHMFACFRSDSINKFESIRLKTYIWYSGPRDRYICEIRVRQFPQAILAAICITSAPGWSCSCTLVRAIHDTRRSRQFCLRQRK